MPLMMSSEDFCTPGKLSELLKKEGIVNPNKLKASVPEVEADTENENTAKEQD